MTGAGKKACIKEEQIYRSCCPFVLFFDEFRFKSGEGGWRMDKCLVL